MSSPKPDTLARLHDLAVFLGADADLNEHLEDLARHAAEATQAAACSIALAIGAAASASLPCRARSLSKV